MRTGPAGIALIKSFEGFRAEPYLCPGGFPTIGYGSRHYPDGRPVELTDPPVSELIAGSILQATLRTYERAVEDMIHAELRQPQFDALVSFTYNLGRRALERSTLRKVVNANPDDLRVETELSRWVFAGGRRLEGLARRRAAEAELYFSKEA